ETLRAAGEKRKWSLREPRRLESCLRLLARGGPNVLVLKVGTDLLREFTLLERAIWLYPDTAVVVIGDRENPALADLAWELGASLVLYPPLARNELATIVGRLLELPNDAATAVDKETGIAAGLSPAEAE